MEVGNVMTPMPNIQNLIDMALRMGGKKEELLQVFEWGIKYLKEK